MLLLFGGLRFFVFSSTSDNLIHVGLVGFDLQLSELLFLLHLVRTAFGYVCCLQLLLELTQLRVLTDHLKDLFLLDLFLSHAGKFIGKRLISRS